jgi:hypothetical protein
MAVGVGMTKMAMAGIRGCTLRTTLFVTVVTRAILRMQMRAHPGHCTQPSGDAQLREELIRQFDN